MTKLILQSLVNLQNENTAVASINSNYTAIQNAVENTLSRDGTTPNQMSADLDMNSNQILNLPTPVENNDPIRKIDLDGIAGFSDLLDLNNAVNSATSSAATATAAALVASNAAAQVIQPPQGRLTLTSGVPITTADVATATTVYYTPAIGNLIPIYNGTSFVTTFFTELSLPLDNNSGHSLYHQGGNNLDFFVISDSGTVRLVTGVSWSSGGGNGVTTRGTGAGSSELELKNGVWTNKNAMTLRFGTASGNTAAAAANKATYVGTMRTTGDGMTEDSIAKRWVWNPYNQAERRMFYIDPAGSWSLTTNVTRQTNNNSLNQLDFVTGLAGGYLQARGSQYVLNNTATVRQVNFGFGLDVTNNFAPGGFVCNVPSDGFRTTTGMFFWSGYPGLGRHFLASLEQGAGTDTQTTTHAGIGGVTGSIWG